MKGKIEKILFACICIICLFYFLAGLFFKPIICSDALQGTLSLHNYLNGDRFNQLLSLSPQGNIISYDMTWWTPGQYQIPYLLSKLCFVNLGTATEILMLLSLLGGCLFYYKLFTISGLGSKLILSALVILLLQRFINIYFIQYLSADLLLFFYTPFYAYTYYYLLKNYPKNILHKLFLLTLINLVGIYIKNSFILFEVALNVFLMVEFLFRAKTIKNIKTHPGKLLLLVPFILANALNYYFFLRLGNNPSQSQGLLLNFSNVLTGIFAPVIEILFASISVYGIYGNFYDKITMPETLMIILMIAALLAIGYVIYRQKNKILSLFNKDICFRFTVVIAAIYVLIWFGFTVTQSAISNEDRLYLPVTILVLPYLLSFAVRSCSWLKYIYFSVIAISVLYGMSSFGLRIKKYTENGSVFSKNDKLNGFKVFSENSNLDPDLNRISSLISSRFPTDHVIVSNFDIAFELNVQNKFIKANTESLKMPDSTKQTTDYIVLVQLKKDKPPVGFREVYSSNKFALYKP